MVRFPIIGSVCVFLGACTATGTGDLRERNKHLQPIPAHVVSAMEAKGFSPDDPILIRIFKKESELEIWKRADDGRYERFKTYPICRWSGRLGPKKRQGDRQAPEGFYQVGAHLMNPYSSYYLSFDLGFPNRLERALGWSGGDLMVHGACSSRGCFAMTDEGIAEIYAIAREALNGGQRSLQVQAYPFRMTSFNMAKFSADPNIDFWRNLKQGYDIFEATRRPLEVSACSGRYVFSARAANGKPLSPTAACPKLVYDLPDDLAERVYRDGSGAAKVSGSSPNQSYIDGSMHARYRAMLSQIGEEAMSSRTSLRRVPVSRPEAALRAPF